MKCQLNIPEDCFTCPFPDCINNTVPAKKEKLFAEGKSDERDKRIKYARKLQKNLERYHQKQLDRHKGERREYFRELHKKRRIRIMKDFNGYVAQLDKEIENHRKGYHDLDQVGMGLLMAKQLFLNCLHEMEKEKE